MASDRRIRLTPEQALHERVMRAVALRMQNLPYVLKGGTALALLYQLDRHSVDLDFDCGSGKRGSIENHIRDGLQDAEVSMSYCKPERRTWKGQRFEAHYIDPGSREDRLLRVELSFRTEPRADDVVIVDRIRGRNCQRRPAVDRSVGP